ASTSKPSLRIKRVTFARSMRSPLGRHTYCPMRGSVARAHARAWDARWNRCSGVNRKAGRREGFLGFGGDSAQAVLDQSGAKSGEEADGDSAELERGEEPGFVNGGEPCAGFDLDHDLRFDHQAEPISAIQERTFVLNR